MDVSGGSATLNTGGGGGAGGSIFIESPGGVFIGSGYIKATGGHGGLDSQGNRHGGAGAGGRIAIKCCRDFFSGKWVI